MLCRPFSDYIMTLYAKIQNNVKMHKILAEISMLIFCAFSAFSQKLEKFILALTTFLTTFPQKMTTWRPLFPCVCRHFLRFMRETKRTKNKAVRAPYLPLSSRSGEIRTRDPLNPIQVRYQTALHPVIGSNRCYYSHSVSLCQHLFF